MSSCHVRFLMIDTYGIKHLKKFSFVYFHSWKRENIISLLWLVTARDTCLIQNYLQRRGYSMQFFFFCYRELETVEHLFLHCSFSRQCWELFLNIMGVFLVIPQNINSLLEIWQAKRVERSVKQIWRTILICIFWTVWLERNMTCLEWKRPQIARVKQMHQKLVFWCYSSTLDRLGPIFGVFGSFRWGIWWRYVAFSCTWFCTILVSYE